MQFLGTIIFYSKIIEKLHINIKPLYTLLHDDVNFQWTPELEKIFNTIKDTMTSDTELTIPNTKNPFFITVDASLIGLGAVPFQINEQNKTKVISFNSRILTTQEQKLSTLDRELLGMVYAIQIYEFLIIGSPHPIILFTDHKPLLHCFTKKGNLSPRFYRAQMQLTKFPRLKIIHTPGKNLSVADMLSRTFTKQQLQLNQLKHKKFPPPMEFAIIKNDEVILVNYLVKHEEVKSTQIHDSHPILADYGDDQFSIRKNDKGNDIIVKPLDSFSFKAIVPFQNKYKKPSKKNNKSLLQQSPLLNDTDILSDDDTDHIYTRIPNSNKDNPSTPDGTLQNQKTNNTYTLHETTELETHSKQIIPFYTPSFFKYKNYFLNFFLPPDTHITLPLIGYEQKQDPILK